MMAFFVFMAIGNLIIKVNSEPALKHEFLFICCIYIFLKHYLLRKKVRIVNWSFKEIDLGLHRYEMT